MKLFSIALSFCLVFHFAAVVSSAELRAGAAVVDVTPVQFPVLVNGGMTSRSASKVNTRVNARAIVLDDGRRRLGIVVVDSCMMPRPLLDEAKQLASQRTKIKPDHMLISATHTHTAPASMGCLGTNADSDLCALPARKACRGAGGGGSKSRTGAGRLGGQERGRFYGAEALDSPPRSHRRRPVRQSYRARQYACRPQLGRRHRRIGPRRPRSFPDLISSARRPADCRAGELLDALLLGPARHQR